MLIGLPPMGLKASAAMSPRASRIGAFTKTVIAICALKLCENGLIDLHARLDDKT
jgi:CubicO group peptidase (beta-lactamase class C family)